jgi:hypothetical protein
VETETGGERDRQTGGESEKVPERVRARERSTGTRGGWYTNERVVELVVYVIPAGVILATFERCL